MSILVAVWCCLGLNLHFPGGQWGGQMLIDNLDSFPNMMEYSK